MMYSKTLLKICQLVFILLFVIVPTYLISGCITSVATEEASPTLSSEASNPTALQDLMPTIENIPVSTPTNTSVATLTPEPTSTSLTELISSPTTVPTPTFEPPPPFTEPILFLANSETNPDQDLIWVVFPDGGDYWTLRPDDGFTIDGPPMWSPDKKWIAYTLVGDETITLHIVDTISQKVELLSQEIPRVAGDPLGETLVLLNGWSPDSQWLGYLIAYPGTFESYLLNIGSGTRLDITPPAGFLYWAQDGSGRFAYPDDWGNLYIGSIDDTTELPGIESSTYYIQSIDWHPTENQLLVTTSETTGWGDKLWRYDIDTDTWTLLKEINVRDAKWSPSGKQIAVYTGSSIRVFDAESLTINHTLGVSFDVFSIWWLDEQNLVLRVRGNLLITPVVGYDGSFYAIDEQDEIYQQMGFVKYTDW